jgi:hypothetical protein
MSSTRLLVCRSLCPSSLEVSRCMVWVPALKPHNEKQVVVLVVGNTLTGKRKCMYSTIQNESIDQ